VIARYTNGTSERGKVARVLFLGGLGRSGTTLVERVLGEVPGVCALGEVVHLWQRDVRDDERCGCGVRFSACEFWTAVGAEAFGGWERVDVDRVLALQAAVERTRHIPRLAAPRLATPFQEQVREYAGHYAAVYRAAARVTGASVVVDSSKHSALAHCLRWALPADDLRVAHVVRDPRGVAYSWTKTVPRPESDGTDAMTRYSPGRSALLWTAHNAAFALLARCGVAVRRIRYEEFLRDPPAAVRDLAAFAGLDLAGEALPFLAAGHVELGPGHTAAGNPMRFTTGRIPLRRDDAWMGALPDGQRRLVGAVCAPLLRRYGYPLRRGSRPLLPRPAELPPVSEERPNQEAQ
jgi:Sulfotransferase family